MNKKEAAAALGLSTRALERYIGLNRISVSYVRGRTGDEARFDRAEVERFREELETRKPAAGAVADEAPTSPDPQPRSVSRLSGLSGSQALESSPARGSMAALGEAIAALLQGQQTPGKRARETATVADLSHKLSLSVKEAARLSGLSEGHLRAAIGKGKLKARIIGKGYRISPDVLRAYVKKVVG
jgi:excisionase family DNA binding protein